MLKNKKLKYNNIFLHYRVSHAEMEFEKKKKKKGEIISLNSKFKRNRPILPKCFLGWSEGVQSRLFSPLHPVPRGCTRMTNHHHSAVSDSFLYPLSGLILYSLSLFLFICCPPALGISPWCQYLPGMSLCCLALVVPRCSSAHNLVREGPVLG